MNRQRDRERERGRDRETDGEPVASKSDYVDSCRVQRGLPCQLTDLLAHPPAYRITITIAIDSSLHLLVNTVHHSLQSKLLTVYCSPRKVSQRLPTALLVYKALHDAMAAYLVDNCQLISHVVS